MRYWPFLLTFCLPAIAAERAAYDSNGRIIADVVGGRGRRDCFERGSGAAQRKACAAASSAWRSSGAVRQAGALSWTSGFELPEGGRGRLELKAEEDASGVRYAATVNAQGMLNVAGIEFVIDLPRTSFVNGRGRADSGSPFALAAVRAAGPVLFRGETADLNFDDATGGLGLSIGFDQPHAATVVDRWDTAGRSFQVRATIARGAMAGGATAALTVNLKLRNSQPAPPPVRLTMDTSKAGFPFRRLRRKLLLDERVGGRAIYVGQPEAGLGTHRDEGGAVGHAAQQSRAGDPRPTWRPCTASSRWVCRS